MNLLAREKFLHYKKLLDAVDLQNNFLNKRLTWILPFVVQSSGLLQKQASEFLERLASMASNYKKIPAGNILTYFKRRLSCSLARNLVQIINDRGAKLVSAQSNQLCDRSFAPRHFMELTQE